MRTQRHSPVVGFIKHNIVLVILKKAIHKKMFDCTKIITIKVFIYSEMLHCIATDID